LAHYEEALSLFFQLNQTRRATFCLVSVGSLHLMKDDFDAALDCFGQAVAYAQAEKGPESLTGSYNLMAYIRENLGRMKL
ncbi:MAG: hypothetical protein R3264_04510, partial [Anaerolineae bacterium]|nr:hypothetical protein [Anaerolineae bacterium]